MTRQRRIVPALAILPLLLLAVWLPPPTPAPAFPVGVAADIGMLGQVPGAVLIPLVGTTPDWFTPALHAQVLGAGGMPVAAPLTAAPLPSEVGIRPGSWMIAPRGCTMNFVFVRNGALGIGTAGHCVDSVGQHVVVLTLAPGTANPVLVDIGTVVIRHDEGLGRDFALVAIHPVLAPWVSPTSAVIGGPCGQYAGSGPEAVAHYGHGVAVGTGGTPRIGIATTWSADSFGWAGAAFFGDSGSPVRVTDFAAAGNLTHAVLEWAPSAVAGTRIGTILQMTTGWTLVHSPLCP